METLYLREGKYVSSPSANLGASERSFLERLALLQRMAELKCWCVEQLTDLTYSNLQMHVQFMLDDDGVVTCRQHCRLNLFGRWQTPWRFLAHLRCDASPVIRSQVSCVLLVMVAVCWCCCCGMAVVILAAAAAAVLLLLLCCCC